MGEIYCLSQNELKALITGTGADYVVGLSVDKSRLTACQTVRALNHLMAEDLISNQGDSFEMTEDIRTIVTAVTGERYISLHSNRLELPAKVLYPGQKIVTCILSGYENAGLCFELHSHDTLRDDMQAEGYLPEDDSMIPLKELNLINDELDDFEQSQAAYECDKPLPATSRILLRADCVNSCGYILSSLRILDYGIYRYILFVSEDKKCREPYSGAAVKNRFEEMLSCDS